MTTASEAVGNGPIDLAHYEPTGGLAMALAKHADGTLQALGDDDRRIAEVMFKRLTEVASDGREVRRPTPLSDIAGAAAVSDDDVRHVVDQFVAHGSFVTVSQDEDPVVDISHESLIRQWPTLKTWVAEEDQRGSDYAKLAESATRWLADEVSLMRDPELELASRWWREAKPNAVWAARYHDGFDVAEEYLAKSRRAEGRRKMRIALAVAVLAALVAVSVPLAVAFRAAENAALDSAAEADASAEAALNSAAEADASAFAARSRELQRDDPALALAVAVEALRATDEPSPEASAALIGASAAFNDLRFVPEHDAFENGAAVTAVSLHPDGSRLAVAGADGLRVWDTLLDDPATDGAVFEWIDGVELLDVEFSPDGSLIAGAGSDGVARVWDAASFERVAELDHILDTAGDDARVMSAAFGPDGDVLVSGDAMGRVWRWDLSSASGTQVSTGQDRVDAVAVHPDGLVIASIGTSGAVSLWDTDLQPISDALGVSVTEPGQGRSLAFRADGMLAAGHVGGLVIVWDDPAGSDEPGWPLNGHTDYVRGLSFGPTDADLLVSSSQDRTTRLWSIQRRTQIGEPLAGRDLVTGVALDADGRHLATGSRDGTVSTWRSAGTLVGRHFGGDGEPQFATAVGFNSDITVLASAGFDGNVRLWDPVTRDVIDDLPAGGEELFALEFSPTAPDLLMVAGSGSVWWWVGGDTLERYVVDEMQGAAIRAVAIDAAGATAASAGDDGVVRLWDVETRQPTGVTVEIEPPDGLARRNVDALVFAPDDVLFIGDTYGRLWRWEFTTGQTATEVAPGGGHFQGGVGANLRGLDISADGELLVSASADTTILQWAVTDSVEPSRRPLLGHTGEVSAANFDPSGDWLASASNDGTARLWWVGPGPPAVVEIVTDSRCVGPGCLALDVAFSPDGRLLATAEGDGEIRLWEDLFDTDTACVIVAELVDAEARDAELPAGYETRGCALDED